jgi:fructose-bisphosphate aldolase class I
MDHSGGSTGGVLERYGQKFNEDNKMDLVHQMRLRMVNSPEFNHDNIWGAILYTDSVDRGLGHKINNKAIRSFLKIDKGCEPNGYLKYFRVDDMIKYALDHECFGTKMRSIVTSADVLEMILLQQFALAMPISEAGLIPIIEPEVPIDHPEKEKLESLLEPALHRHLDTFAGKCILKLTLPEKNNLYNSLTRHVSVDRVVALSGGYSTSEACSRLTNQNNITASFSRALSEGLFYNQSDDEFNVHISKNISDICKAGE